MLSGMSRFVSESDNSDYACASPFHPTRIHGPFLDDKAMFSCETGPEDQENGIFSQSTQSDECSGEPDPTTSTPDLSFAASSSPFLISERGGTHTASSDRLRYGEVAPIFKQASDHASFVHRLDYLLQQVADQQFHSRASDNLRIQHDFSNEILSPVSPFVSIVHDAVPESELSPIESDSRFSTLPLQKLPRPSSLVDGTFDDHTVATVSHHAGHDSRRNKRKARAASDEGFKGPATGLIHDRAPSDSYLSASDVASPAPTHCPGAFYPPSKKRKYLSLGDSQLSRADSLSLSDTSLLHSKLSLVQGQQVSAGSSTTHHASKGTQFPSPSRTVSQDEQDFEVIALSNHSPSGSDCSYPPTEIATPVPCLSPFPVLEPRDFPEADIPRVFWSGDDAAEARLLSLIRKEAPYHRTCSLVPLDLTSRGTLVAEVIAWILTVEPPLGSPTASSIRGRIYSHDLYEQLTVHNDSRFLATLIFSLFFVHSGGDSKAQVEVDQLDTEKFEELKEDKGVFIWDYAVAAIALAVKMHRDSFAPLKPIFGHHFLALAPHEMCFEDLELAQRELLEHFSYHLGMPTPQQFLDELRIALPTLRHVLESEHEWKDVLSETWKQLFAAARWPSMLRFPVSLLTATALIGAIRRVVHRRLSLMKFRARAERLDCTCDCHVKPAAPFVAPRKAVPGHEPSDAELDVLRATSAVFEDIREVLGLSVEKTSECEEWLALVRSASEKPLRSQYFPDIST